MSLDYWLFGSACDSTVTVNELKRKRTYFSGSEHSRKPQWWPSGLRKPPQLQRPHLWWLPWALTLEETRKQMKWRRNPSVPFSLPQAYYQDLNDLFSSHYLFSVLPISSVRLVPTQWNGHRVRNAWRTTMRWKGTCGFRNKACFGSLTPGSPVFVKIKSTFGCQVWLGSNPFGLFTWNIETSVEDREVALIEVKLILPA